MSSSRLKTYAAVTVGTAAAEIFDSTEHGVTTLILLAPSANPGTIYVGDSDVDASVARGIPLVAGASVTLTSDQARGGGTQLLALSGMWADATAANCTLNITAIATD